MRGPLVVAACQPVCRSGDLAGTAREHAAAVRQADARIVLFPELSLTGYELDADAVALDHPALDAIVAACADHGSMALAGAPIEEDGRRSIAVLRIEGSGVTVAYRKTHLGGDEPGRFDPGDGPTAITVDGWRVGLGACKDTGVAEHVDGVAALGVDLYLAGLVHHAEELGEQDARGRRIAAACASHVAFASFAGPTGGGYAATAGTSTVWSPAGDVIARAGAAPGDLVRAELGGSARRVGFVVR